MNYQLLAELKVKTKQGEIILSPGQIIELNPSKADQLLAQGKIKATSLEETLDSILLNSKNRIIEVHKGRQYQATDETRSIEQEIDRIYKAILENQASIPEFQNACERWVLLCKENLIKRSQTKPN